MAATGKKGKKAKWVKASITDIIAEPTTIPTTQNWAESVEDDTTESYGYGSRTRAPVVLPSASRAARGGLAVDDESIPRRPPFVAHISNLPYDVDETAITELFDGLKILNLRLPREGDRLKGYGYVDFEDRESLINAMNMPDLTIGGRRIRIDVSTQDNDRRMGRTGRNDRERDYDPERTMGDWRSGPRAAPEPGRERDRDRGGPDRGPMTREGMRERDADRPDRGPMTREGMRERDSDRGPMTREGMRERDSDRGPMTREGMRERDSDSSAADNRPGGWRDGDRPAADPARTPYGGRDSFGRDRDRDGDRGFGGRERGGAGYGREGERERGGYGGRDGFRAAPERDGGGGFGNRDRDRGGFGGRGFGDRDRDPPPREDGKPRERPKLNLLPRTVPREAEAPTKPADGAPLEDKPAEKPAPKPVSAEKVFGAAKPVDTAAKEREIEERLRKQEEEARRTTEDKERWGGRKNDHSGDRRAGGRRDDRGRDTRSYNKDRRDHSKDSKDRRDYSKDSKDRRDYSKDNKDRRDYSKDSKDRRDYSRDDKDRRDDRREYSGERRDASGDRRRPDSPQRGDKRRDSQERNGDEKHTDETRPSRSRDRHDDTAERPLPKLKEVEKPNFVASNKFSFLEDDVDAGSD